MAVYKEVPQTRVRNRVTRTLTSDAQTKTRNIITNFITYFKGKKFSVIGFDFPLPLEKKIISLAEFSQRNTISKSDYLLYTFSSFEDEIRAAYNWAKKLIAKPSDSRIAIVLDKQDLEYATIIGRHMKIAQIVY